MLEHLGIGLDKRDLLADKEEKDAYTQSAEHPMPFHTEGSNLESGEESTADSEDNPFEGLQNRQNSSQSTLATSNSSLAQHLIRNGLRLRRGDPVQPSYRTQSPKQHNSTIDSSSGIDYWLAALEEHHHKEASARLEKLVELNQRLLSISDTPEAAKTAKHDVHSFMEYFSRSSAFNMPEIIQMMTNPSESEQDERGCFNWGLRLIVARDDYRLRVHVVGVFGLIALLDDPFSSVLAKYSSEYLFQLLCASPAEDKASIPLILARSIALYVALQSYTLRNTYLVFLARHLLGPNPTWEAKFTSTSDYSSIASYLYLPFSLAAIFSCSQLAPSMTSLVLWGPYLLLTTAIFTSTLWRAEGWFGSHPNPAVQIFKFGPFFTLVTFLLSVGRTEMVLAEDTPLATQTDMILVIPISIFYLQILYLIGFLAEEYSNPSVSQRMSLSMSRERVPQR